MKENKKQLIFLVEPELANEFKIYSAKKQSNMTELMKEMIKKAIELDIYVDINKKNN